MTFFNISVGNGMRNILPKLWKIDMIMASPFGIGYLLNESNWTFVDFIRKFVFHRKGLPRLGATLVGLR